VGLVVPARIEGERPQQLPVFGENPNVEVGHEHEHAGADEPAPTSTRGLIQKDISTHILACPRHAI
jgi:hypothetical protein